MVPAETERLRFRKWRAEDAPLGEALWGDAEVTRFFGGPMSPEQVKARIAAEIERDARLGFQYWAIELRETGEFAGCAGLRQWQDDPNVIEVGVNIMRFAWGKRVGEEAVRAVLRHGFEVLGLERIVAGHGMGHENSQKLLERVGFRYTRDGIWGPKEVPVRWYAVDVDGWQNSDTLNLK